LGRSFWSSDLGSRSRNVVLKDKICQEEGEGRRSSQMEEQAAFEALL
jgi:hypothetical protein